MYIIRDDKLIANLFNKYFCETGQKLAAKIKSNTDYKAYMTNTKTITMFIQPVTEQEIGKIISSLNTNKSIADIDIPIKFKKMYRSDKNTNMSHYKYAFFQLYISHYFKHDLD